MDKPEIIQLLRALNLPPDQYLVGGGASLAIREIREARDIDVIVLPELFEKLAKIYPRDLAYRERWGRERLKNGLIEIYPDYLLENANEFLDVQTMLNEAEIVEGIRLENLRSLVRCKLDTARETDLRDVELIYDFLTM